jgi:hypothetical protein
MFMETIDVLNAYEKNVCTDDPRSRAAAAQRKAGISEIEQQYNRYEDRAMKARELNDEISLAHALVAACTEEIPALNIEHLRGINDGDLDLLRRAAMSTANLSGDSVISETALRFFSEYERRGPVDSTDITRMFNILLHAKNFDGAAQFAAQHPQAGLPAIPAFVNTQTSLPSVWREDSEGRWVRQGIDLTPLQVIVIAGCHFSADAAQDISNDPVLGPVFAQHARWLSDVPGTEDLNDLADWNRKYPKAPMEPIHERGEWAMFPVWKMPTFQIIRDGKIIETVVGWRDNREALVAALKHAGLLAVDEK